MREYCEIDDMLNYRDSICDPWQPCSPMQLTRLVQEHRAMIQVLESTNKVHTDTLEEIHAKLKSLIGGLREEFDWKKPTPPVGGSR